MNVLKTILTLIPFVWTIVLLPFCNRVEPIIMGLPFLAFWLSSGIYVAFVCLFVIYHIDERKLNLK